MADPMTHHRILDQQTIQLPHTQDGRINYTVLGNMMSAKILEEVLKVSYVDYEYGQTRKHLLKDSDSNWEFCYKEKDVIVFRKKLQSSRTHCFLGRGVVDAPLHKVAEYVHKFHNRIEWDNFLVQIEICRDISENDWLLYMAHEAKQCFFTSKRDFLYYCRTGYVDNKYIQTSMSVEDKDYPHRPPYIRGEIKIGSGWVLEKYEGSECSTLVSYLAHLDLKDLKAAIVDIVFKRQPMAIHHIRKRLTTPSKLVQNSTCLRSTTPTYVMPPQEMFEDTIPVEHYIRQDSDKSEELDTDSPMYPWVVDQEEWEKKQAERSQKEKGKPRTHSSSLPKSPDKKSDKDQRRRSSSAVESHPPSSSRPMPDQSHPSLQLPDYVSRSVPSGKEEQTIIDPSSSHNFPSFSSWKRQQKSH